MKISVSTLSFMKLSLEEAAGLIRALGFNAMDVDGCLDTTIRREGILKVSQGEIKRLKAFNMILPNIHWTFEKGGMNPPINDPDINVRTKHKNMFKRLTEFCHEATILSILVLPGVFVPGQSVADARNVAADVLNEFMSISKEANVKLAIEAHVGSIIESPESALEFVNKVPDLGVVHDYAHFICQGYSQESADTLIPKTIHIHMRQAKPGLLQTELQDGTINFALVLDQLHQINYDGYLCIEYVYSDYIGATNVDVVTETIKMRDFLKTHLKGRD